MYFSMIIYVFLAHYFFIVNGEWADCGYGQWQNTECIRLMDCHGLVVKIRKLHRTDTVAHQSFLARPLHNMTCGFDGNLPKVCCPVNNREVKTFDDNFLEDDPVNLRSPLPATCGNILWTKSLTPDGAPTELEEFPWLALLEYNSLFGVEFGCGGVLVSNRYVLTAAHCVTPQLTGIRLGEYDVTQARDCKIKPGTWNVQQCNERTIVVGFDRVIVHPGYANTLTPFKIRDNDIALLHLRYPVSFNDYIKPVCLPGDDSIPTQSKFLAAGWGATLNKPFLISPVKRNSRLTVYPKHQCEGIYRMRLNRDFICTMGKTNRSSCVGDSGGPLMTFDRQSRMVVAGIMTAATDNICQYNTIPAIYTDVRKHKKWILENMK